MADQSGVQSLERTFSLIDILADAGEELSLNSIAKKSGLNKSTTHRILSALVSRGYAKNNEGRYSLTLKMFEIGSQVLNRTDIMVSARPHLEQLRDQVHETIHLVTLDGIHIVYIQKLECNLSAYQMASRIGMRRPAYCTAAGKSMLSAAGDSEISEIWETSEIMAYTENTITELSALYQELEETRKTGLSYDNEENELGMRCVASPIWDYAGSSKYAISVSVPIIRMDDNRAAEIGKLVKASAEAISFELGYKPRV